MNWTEPEAFWLSLTNAALGIITLAALLTIAGAMGAELYERMKKRAAHTAEDVHILHVPEIGLTMADGGEKIDEKDGSDHKDRSPIKGGN